MVLQLNGQVDTAPDFILFILIKLPSKQLSTDVELTKCGDRDYPRCKQADGRKPYKRIFPPLSRFGENCPTLLFHTNVFL
jgi:hypothetical protein